MGNEQKGKKIQKDIKSIIKNSATAFLHTVFEDPLDGSVRLLQNKTPKSSNDYTNYITDDSSHYI